MVLKNGLSYQNASGPFRNGPLEQMDLAMDLAMDLGDGPGKMVLEMVLEMVLGDGPGRWTWEMDLGNASDVP